MSFSSSQDSSLLQLIERSPDNMLAVDRHYLLRAFSKPYAIYSKQAYGRRPKSGLDVCTGLFQTGEEEEHARSLLARAFSGESFRCETRRTTLDGATLTLSASLVPVEEMVVVTIRDITEERKHQRQNAALVSRADFLDRVYRQTFELAAIGLANIALDGRFMRVNQSFCEITGRSEEELLSLDIQRITHGDDLESSLMLAHRLLSGEVPSYKTEKRYVRPDGSIVWVLLSVTLVWEGPEPAYFIASLKDITERKTRQLQDKENDRRLRLAMSLGQTATFSFDQNLRYTWMYSPVLGYNPKGVVGKTELDLFEPKTAAMLEQIYRYVLDTGKRFRGDVRVVPQHQPQDLHFDLIVEPVRDNKGRITGLLCAAVDITARKTDLLELQAAKQQAEEARQLAEQASDAKTRFLAAASHDLRQPLQAMRLLLHLLQKEVAAQKRATELARRIDRTLASTETLLSRLMEFAALESGKVTVKWEPIELDSLIHRVVGEHTSEAAHKELRLYARTFPCVTYSDPVLLERMVRNLLTNAIRYTEKGRILVGVRGRGSRLRIEVRDTGVGIPKDQCQVIFEEFRQLSNPERDRSKGSGLGLAIVARTARLLDHPLSVVSNEGKGSVFSIEVPTYMAASTDSAAAPASMADQRKCSILLVEDDPTQAIALEMLLSDLGHAVHVANDLESAMAAIRQSTPHLILSDNRLADGLTGIELIKRLREASTHPIPAILVTGDISADIADVAQGAGCSILHKPYSLPELTALIDDTLNAVPT